MLDFAAKLAELRAAHATSSTPKTDVSPVPASIPTSAPVGESSQYAMIKNNIAALEAALLANNPTIPVLLTTIKRTLKNDPAIVTLLSEEEICNIVRGLERQTNTYIAQSMSKSRSTETKKLKNSSAADLGF